MAFEGNLRDLEFGDVVQTLSMTRQHGTLVVQGTDERRIAFTDRGLALLSARKSHEERVGSYLVGAGHATPEALEAARRATRRAGAVTIGDALLSAEAVTERQLHEARHYVAQDDLFDLFRWTDGAFEFHNDELDLSGPFATIWFDVGGVAMEAARRIDESPQLDSLVPPGQVLVHADPACAPAADATPADLPRLHELADGTRTVGDIVKAHHLGQFDTRKRLASLVDSGALRPATPSEILAVVSDAAEPECAARLLQRAVTLEPTNAKAWGLLAKSLAAAGKKPAASEALINLAELQYSTGEGESALGTLKTALKLHRQCARAHAAMTRTLFALGLVDEGVEAARDAVTECLAAEAPQTALEIAQAALEHVPEDVRLARAQAAAHADLGQVTEAVAILDRIAHDLTRTRGGEKQLIEVYRSILSLAPDRADCHEKLQAIAQREALRKRRRRQFVAIAAGIALLAAIAVPAVFGSNVQERLDAMNELVTKGELDRVQVLLNELRDENIDEELLANAAQALERRIEQSKRPPLDEALPRELKTRLNAIYTSSQRALAERRMTEGLKTLTNAVPEISSDVMKVIELSDPNAAKLFRDGFDTEVASALAETEENCVALVAWVTRAESTLESSEALKRARFRTESGDIDELESLAALAAEIEAKYALNDWETLPALCAELIAATNKKPSQHLPKIEATLENFVSAVAQARELGEHAVAHVNRLRLLTRFRNAKNEGSDFVREGKLEDAVEIYRSYLKFCDEVRSAKRGEVYERIVSGYLDAFQLESLIGEQLTQAEDILARERTAADALYTGEVDTAFEMRVALVRQYPHVGFGARFSLPLRIESRPPGAQIVLVDGAEETSLGRTTSIVEYPAVGESTIVVRLEGFEDVVLQRHGAFEDADGTESLDLMKRPLWRSEGGAATEASPVTWRDRIILADRDGVVRALSLEDGSELGRLETGLLGGFAGTPTVHEDRLYLAGVDGVGFVVDPTTLEISRRFDLPGAVRTSLLATPAGVVIVDERGTVHLVDENGGDIWTRDVGRIAVDPVVTGDRIVVVTLEGNLVVLSLTDGAERRRIRVPGQPRWSAPVIVGKHAFVSAERGTVTAIDLERGVVDWSADTEETLTGRPAVAGDVIAVPAASGIMLLFEHGSDEPPARTEIVGPMRDGVTALDGGFVAAGRTGVVRRIDLRGDLAWRFDAGDAIGAPPLRTAGRVLIVTRAGQVIALED